MMLTTAYTEGIAEMSDENDIYGVFAEWALRETRYRRDFPEEIPQTIDLLDALPPARDAGDVCAVCHNLVTWVDHLPPAEPGAAVRCFVDVLPMRPEFAHV